MAKQESHVKPKNHPQTHSLTVDGNDADAHQSGMREPPATNRIQKMLDEFGIDWRSTRAQLNAKLPIQVHQRTCLEIQPVLASIPLGDLEETLHAHAEDAYPWHLPPAMLEGDLHSMIRLPWDKAAHAMSVAARRITRRLDRPIVTRSDGAISLRWTDQAGSIDLTRFKENAVFPAYLCHVTIISGWRVPLSTDDRATVARMDVVGRGRRRGVAAFMQSPARNDDIAYVRDPDMSWDDLEDLDGVVGYDSRTETIIGCDGQLVMIRLDDMVAMHHLVRRDGQGRGCEIVAETRCGSKIRIAHHDDPDGLSLVSRALAKATGRRLGTTERIGAKQ